MDIIRRGYVTKDEYEFGDQWINQLNCAAEEISYLVNRGYDIKSSSTFIGNHYLLSQRQRLALTRMISSKEHLDRRKKKELPYRKPMDTVHIDGFNTIITLEVALSNCLLIKGEDGTIRDLAGLRGTYKIIDKTGPAIQLILNHLDSINTKNTIFYLDRPVSNSGRLKQYIQELAKEYKTAVALEVIDDVDRSLYQLDHVITTDAIILDQCSSWYNLNHYIIQEHMKYPWIFQLNHGPIAPL